MYLRVMNTLWIGLGGALGTIARYHVGLVAVRRGAQFPWGTLAVNLVGSLLLAVLMQLALRGRVDDTMRLALGTGVLGGFTTYSTFNFETFAMAQSGAWARAGAYVVATVVGGLAAGALGWFAARSI
jgi:fluoride exporter